MSKYTIRPDGGSLSFAAIIKNKDCMQNQIYTHRAQKPLTHKDRCTAIKSFAYFLTTLSYLASWNDFVW